MSLTGHRVEEYRVELLASNERSIQPVLDGVKGGQLTWNASADIPGGGTLEIDDLNQALDFSSQRVRIWYKTFGTKITQRDAEYTAWVEKYRNLFRDPFGKQNPVTSSLWASSQTTLSNVTDSGTGTSWIKATRQNTSAARFIDFRIPENILVADRRYRVQFIARASQAMVITPAIRPDTTIGTGSVSASPITIPAGVSTQAFEIVAGSDVVFGPRGGIALVQTSNDAVLNQTLEVRSVSVATSSDTPDFFNPYTPNTDLTRTNWDGPANNSETVYEERQIRNYDRVIEEESYEWPLGVYVMAAPTTAYSEFLKSRSITLIDKLTVVRDDVLTSTYQVVAGGNIINAVVAQINAAGEYKIATTPSTKTLKNAMTWGPGTSRLKVINDLLTAAGYSPLWTDGMGQYRVEPYLRPNRRATVFTFKEGETSIHAPDWTYNMNIWEASNTVVLVSQPDSNGSFWKAVAEDRNPNSPTSLIAMNRVLNPIVQENVEAASLADLQDQADRILVDNSNVVGKLSVAHAMMDLWYNDKIRFISQGMDTFAIITQMSIQLTPGSLVSAEWSQA